MKKIAFLGIAFLLFSYACSKKEVSQEKPSGNQDGKDTPGVPIELGTAAAVSESRGIVAYRMSDGNSVIMALSQDILDGRTRTSLLMINPKTGKTDQYFHPLDGPNGESTVSRENYSSMLASSGKFYTMMGDVFLEFDPNSRKWTFNKKIEGRAMSFAEAPDGKIFFANYPQSSLYSFDPKTKNLVYHGRLDNVQQYPYSLVVGKDGWVYSGIGTAKSNLVAFNVATGQLRSLMVESDRKTGEGYVFTGEDKVIYATHLKGQTTPLFRLENGQKIQVTPTPSALPKSLVTGAIFWNQRLNDFPGGGKITEFVLRDKSGKITDEAGVNHSFTFDYQTSGANITSFTLGPDGGIWGSTSHPIRLWHYNPKTKTIGNWNGLSEISGANFPNLVAMGKKIYGALYNGGMVRIFDTSKPGNYTTNPPLIGTFAEIARPRAATTTSDRTHIVFGGYPGYGEVGGDLVFVNIFDEKPVLVRVQDQLPGLSTISLRPAFEGVLVGGTSIATPGGGRPTATQAKLYLMDEATRKVIYQMVPVTSGSDIESLEVRNKLVYGVTADSQLFIFDPQTRQIVSRTNISAFGTPTRPGQSLLLGQDGNIYGVMSKSLFKIDAQSVVTKLTGLPEEATGGIAFYNNILYFACGSKLWSYQVK